MLVGHTSVHKFKRVIVQYRDGRKVIDKFLDKKSRYLFFEKLGKVNLGDIKTLTIYKGEGTSTRHQISSGADETVRSVPSSETGSDNHRPAGFSETKMVAKPKRESTTTRRSGRLYT